MLIHDLHTEEVYPDVVRLSQTYIQIYERQPEAPTPAPAPAHAPAPMRPPPPESPPVKQTKPSEAAQDGERRR